MAAGNNYTGNTARIDSLGIRWVVLDCDTHTAENITVSAARHHNVVLRLCRPDLTTDLIAWRAYVRSAAQTYGPAVHSGPRIRPCRICPVRYYQIWNKPNRNSFLPVTAQQWRDEVYTNLLQAAYTEIKAVGPSLQVIAMNTDATALKGAVPPAVYGIGSNDWGYYTFIKAVHQRGGGVYYDVLGVEPYTLNFGGSGLDSARILSPEAGEVAWPSIP